VNSLLGPLAADVVDYPVSRTVANQTVGLDAVTLVVVAPLAALAAVLTRRRHPAAPFLAVVVGAYTAYMFVQYVVGPDHPRYPGVLLLQTGLFTLGWVVAATGWTAARAVALPEVGAHVRGRQALVLFALAAFVVLRYLPAVPGSAEGALIPEGSRADPAMFWTIFLMDVGVFVPLVVAAGVAHRRGAGWAARALPVVVGWFALVTLVVLAMSVVMVLDGDPYAGPGLVALFAVTAVVVVAYVARLSVVTFARGAVDRGTAGRATRR
jgi:hypothetical protein